MMVMRVQALRNVGEARIYAAQNKTNALIIATSYKKYLENQKGMASGGMDPRSREVLKRRRLVVIPVQAGSTDADGDRTRLDGAVAGGYGFRRSPE
jgi:hypothetical protein